MHIKLVCFLVIFILIGITSEGVNATYGEFQYENNGELLLIHKMFQISKY